MDHDYSDCLGPKYTIPGLILSLLGTCAITANEISYVFLSLISGQADHSRIEEICDALGYPLDQVSQSLQNIYAVEAISTDGSATTLGLEFEILDPSAFGTSNQTTPSEVVIQDATLSYNMNTSQSDHRPRAEQQQSEVSERFIPCFSQNGALVPTTRKPTAPIVNKQLVLRSNRDGGNNSWEVTASDIGVGPPRSSARSVLSMDHQSVASASPHTTLLLLFHAMGDRVPKILFDRATTNQKRVDMYGKHYEVTPKAAAVDSVLTDLLEKVVLEQAMDYLISQAQISLRDGIYICEDEPSRVFFEQRKDYWTCQAFALCCCLSTWFRRRLSVSCSIILAPYVTHVVKAVLLGDNSSAPYVRLYARSQNVASNHLLGKIQFRPCYAPLNSKDLATERTYLH